MIVPRQFYFYVTLNNMFNLNLHINNYNNFFVIEDKLSQTDFLQVEKE